MKRHFIQNMKHYAAVVIATALSLASMSSCRSIFDEAGDCEPHCYLQFVFERNMFYNDEYQIGADAFAAQVGSVEAYIFEQESGKLVAHYSDEGAPLRQDGYRIAVDLEPDVAYDIIAWCGLAGNEGHFAIPSSISDCTDLKCRMDRSVDEDGMVYSDKNLKAVFHGRIQHTFPNTEGEHTAVVYLTKDTNYIQLALHHRHGGYIDPERFTVTIDDANGYMAHDNSLLEDDEIQYRPWSKRGGEVDMEGGDAAFFVAELATSRLLADHRAQIKVTDTLTGNVVFSIPLIKYILMMKSDRHSAMGDQEYLDREDEYNILVFLENLDDKGWMNAQIVINGWHLVDNGIIGL